MVMSSGTCSGVYVNVYEIFKNVCKVAKNGVRFISVHIEQVSSHWIDFI
jgi:hypothetical protein